MTDGSGSDHREYNSLTADRLGRKVPGSVGFFIFHLRKEIFNERNSVKILMQSKSETSKSIYERWK